VYAIFSAFRFRNNLDIFKSQETVYVTRHIHFLSALSHIGVYMYICGIFIMCDIYEMFVVCHVLSSHRIAEDVYVHKKLNFQLTYKDQPKQQNNNNGNNKLQPQIYTDKL
jgi:hypothetical protein